MRVNPTLCLAVMPAPPAIGVYADNHSRSSFSPDAEAGHFRGKHDDHIVPR